MALLRPPCLHSDRRPSRSHQSSHILVPRFKMEGVILYTVPYSTVAHRFEEHRRSTIRGYDPPLITEVTRQHLLDGKFYQRKGDHYRVVQKYPRKYPLLLIAMTSKRKRDGGEEHLASVPQKRSAEEDGADKADPDAQYWGLKALTDRGCEIKMLDEGRGENTGEATFLDQGRSGICVRCAIASAIEVQVELKTEVKLASESILGALM